MPITHEADRARAASTRTQVAASLSAIGVFKVQSTAELDRVLGELSTAGITCTGRDDACLIRLAVNAGLDVLVVGAVETTAEGRVLTIRMLDARGAPLRSARGVIRSAADAPDVVRRLFDSQPPMTADPTSGGSTAPSDARERAPREPELTTTGAPIVSIASFGVAGVTGLAALGCGVATVMQGAKAWDRIDDYLTGATQDPDESRSIDAAVLGLGACTVAAALVSVGAALAGWVAASD
jgi:hypothetical protein